MYTAARCLALAVFSLMALVGCGAAEAEPVTLRLVVTSAVPDDVLRWEVPLGSEVTIEISSEVSEELHLHGYELTADLQPGSTTTMEFTTDMTGAFEIETHGDQVIWAKLVVQ